MSQFKVGDIIILTHRHPEHRANLCVLGKILSIERSTDHPALRIDTLWKYDPEDFDRHAPGWWPTDGAYFIERCGPPDEEVPTDAV